jgi:DNA-directed RNA polymerase subunit M/transcription elongation factor TFIIS
MRDFVNQDGAEGHNTNGRDTCEHCGYTGQDVERTVQYVGGRGDVEMALCQNRVACWRRWNASAQLRSCPKCHSTLIERSEDGPRCFCCGNIQYAPPLPYTENKPIHCNTSGNRRDVVSAR